MISVDPQSTIYLCRTPLENDYKHQLTFANRTAQLNYFNTTIQKTSNDYTYIKIDNTVKVGYNINEIINCNYLFYRNVGFTDKYYYCFITNMQYVNENCTLISFETDCFQTWLFDINFNASFVEREHVNDDTIGLHTVPEGLETGDYISAKNSDKYLNNPTDFYICMAVTELPDESIPPYTNHRQYNGIFGGLYYLAFKTASDCETAIKMYDTKDKSDAINSVFMIPKNLNAITDGTEATWTISAIGSCTVIYLKATTSADTVGIINCTMPTTVGKTYIPKNQKLFTYPFSFINIANNSGNTTPFRYEDFNYENNVRTISFYIDACITPGMSMKCYPLFYKNINLNYNYGLMLGKLPICSWNTDVYLNWLTQNGLNNAFKLVGGVTNTITGVASGSLTGTLSGISGVYNAVHEMTLADITPNQANGNSNSGDVNFSNRYDGGVTIYYNSIKDEYAEIIDKYFNMFGYKVNMLKVPNIYGRQNWNFVKTIDCNFSGNIPQGDMRIIKSMFNNGITLWHNPSIIYNYDNDNSIIGGE